MSICASPALRDAVRGDRRLVRAGRGGIVGSQRKAVFGADGHQIFLEPEGLNDRLVYPNGISTSLPADVQIALVRTIKASSGLRSLDRAMR